MSLTRRKFLETSMGAGAGIAAARILQPEAGAALPAAPQASSPADARVVPAPTGEWITNTPASAWRAYRSKPAKTADAATWVQIELGAIQPIDYVKVYPANEKLVPGKDEDYAGEGFP